MSQKNPSHEQRFTSEKNINTLTLSQSISHIQESTTRKGASISEEIEHPDSEVVLNTSN